ncbi:microfibrillar-associated protein 3-like [Spinachia spinachia]
MLPPHEHLLRRPLPPLLLLLLAGLLLLGGGSQAESSSSSGGSMLAKEGSSARIVCNVTGGHEDIKWYNSKGHLLGDDAGGKWNLEEHGVLNITVVSFDDRGLYTCVANGTESYAVTLRVAQTDGALGLYYVIVCLVTFTVTMILNVARLCMVGSHLKKTERAINEFFRTEGAEKLQKAFEVAKRIPIVTTAKTLELAKVTQFKTMEFARHMEDLARSVPLPPLILNCRTSTEDVVQTADASAATEQCGKRASRNRQAIGPASAGRDDDDATVRQALLSSGENRQGAVDVKVSVHTASEKTHAGEEDARVSLHQPGSRTSVSYESNV